jgi:L-aspartate oxidase
MLRHESRGLHFSRDYPAVLPEARNTVLQQKTEAVGQALRAI